MRGPLWIFVFLLPFASSCATGDSSQQPDPELLAAIHEPPRVTFEHLAPIGIVEMTYQASVPLLAPPGGHSERFEFTNVFAGQFPKLYSGQLAELVWVDLSEGADGDQALFRLTFSGVDLVIGSHSIALIPERGQRLVARSDAVASAIQTMSKLSVVGGVGVL
ncbi:MAG: hypothetical protein DHS20C21_03480 [Gemmatimonadota bacterium]|nr:MAG: hypothetical protein DHS20C21_03480 [Gemmatimonadota bacterium]